MNHLGLFAGIGGFELAARWMGWETVAWCEWNPFCQRVLKYHFPEAEAHSDIKETDFKKYANRIDILTGGFPCQPYSTAGKRKGKEDERHLWPEMLRAIREVSPRWVVGENVRGLTNWNGGLVFDEVQADLENQGFEVLPFLLPACSKDAPHQRDRIWFIAHSESNGNAGQSTISERQKEYEKIRANVFEQIARPGFQRTFTDTCSAGLSEPFCGKFGGIHETEGTQPRRELSGTFTEDGWQGWPTQSPICGGNDGISRELDGITFSKWRNESIKAYGNAVVPAVAYEIFKCVRWDFCLKKYCT